MSAMLDTAPATNSYRYVVRRLDKDADHDDAQPIAFSTYDEATDSRAIELDGVVAHTLFLHGDVAFERARCLGWQDITAQWEKALEDAKPKLTTAGQRQIFAALTGEWQDKATLLRLGGCPDSEWRTALRSLEDKGLVEFNFTARARRKMAGTGNLLYRYRRGPRAGEISG